MDGILTHGEKKCFDRRKKQAVRSVDWDSREIEKNRELRVYKDLQMYKQGIENYVSADEDADLYYNNPIEVAAREYAAEWTWKYIEYIDST